MEGSSQIPLHCIRATDFIGSRKQRGAGAPELETQG